MLLPGRGIGMSSRPWALLMTRAAETKKASDNSPSLKGRGFYGLAPMLCCPTAMRLVSFNTGEVECAAPASRTSTTSKIR